MLEDTAANGPASALIGRIPMFGAHGARTRVVFGALLVVVLAGGPGVTAFGASSSAPPSAPSKVQSIAAAKSGAASAGQGSGLGGGEKLVVKDVITDADGSTHVRYDRTFDGLRVIGGDFVSHRDKYGKIKDVSWNGTHQVAVASTKPKTSLALASAAGTRKASLVQETATAATKGELVVYSCLLYTSDAADEEDSVDLG